MTTTTTETEIKATIDRLMTAGTTADLRALDAIYHDDMRIEMIDTEGGLVQTDKPTFIAMMQQMAEASSGADNSWARYNGVEGDAAEGHVLITRKVTLGGESKILKLSIDLVHEDDRWQVIREVVFARPNPHVAMS